MAGSTSLTEVLRDSMESRLGDAHTIQPAKIVSFDRATNTAEVVLTVKRTITKADGSELLEEVPPIQNVPVALPKGGGFYLRLPLEAGDEGVVMFSEVAWGHFRETGQLSPPGDLRRHSLSYAAFLPCGLVNNDQYDTAGAAVLIVPSESHLSVRNSGEPDDFVVLVNKLKAAIDAAASSGSGGAVPNDGGKAAFISFGKAFGAFNADDLGSLKLKAGSDS